MKPNNIDIEHHLCLAEFYDAVVDTRSEYKGISLVEIAYTFLDIFDEEEIKSLADLFKRRYEEKTIVTTRDIKILA